jgi:hypothetical protein
MPMLAFMPWLRLQGRVDTGGVVAFPFPTTGDFPEGIKGSIQEDTVRKVLSQYMLAPKRSAGGTVLVSEGKLVGDDLNHAELARIFEFGRHLAVAGMSTRRFDGGYLNDYTATGHYQVIVQMFPEPFTGSISLTHRRKDGQSRVTLGQTNIHFWLPDYLVGQGTPKLDSALLVALSNLSSVKDEWTEEVAAACVQFLLANSDSPDVSPDVLSIATYAAMERVSQSSQNLSEAQSKLTQLLSIAEDSPWTGQFRQHLGKDALPGGEQFQDWVKKLYALRGSVAHGKPPPAHGPWSQDEHLLAGAFVFPLVLKCLLASKGLYQLTEDDVVDTLGIEGLLGARPFFAMREPDESEFKWRERCGWILKMRDIASAVMDLTMHRSLAQTLEQIEARDSGAT